MDIFKKCFIPYHFAVADVVKNPRNPLIPTSAQPGAVMLDVGSQDHPAALQPWRNIQRSGLTGWHGRRWQVSTTNGCRRAPPNKKNTAQGTRHKTGELMMNFGCRWIMVDYGESICTAGDMPASDMLPWLCVLKSKKPTGFGFPRKEYCNDDCSPSRLAHATCDKPLQRSATRHSLAMVLTSCI